VVTSGSGAPPTTSTGAPPGPLSFTLGVLRIAGFSLTGVLGKSGKAKFFADSGLFVSLPL
jgi:hypothetical protein